MTKKLALIYSYAYEIIIALGISVAWGLIGITQITSSIIYEEKSIIIASLGLLVGLSIALLMHFFSSIQSSKFGHYFHHIKADGKFLIAYSWPLVAHAMSICAIIFGSDKSPFLFKSILIFCISYSLINTCTVITNTFHLNKMKHNFDILSRQHTE